MIECPWCGAHTQIIKKTNGDHSCGRCKRTILEDAKKRQINKRIQTMYTAKYRNKIREKIYDRTRDWPDLEKGARRNPEPIWTRLLKGKRYDTAYVTRPFGPPFII